MMTSMNPINLYYYLKHGPSFEEGYTPALALFLKEFRVGDAYHTNTPDLLHSALESCFVQLMPSLKLDVTPVFEYFFRSVNSQQEEDCISHTFKLQLKIWDVLLDWSFDIREFKEYLIVEKMIVTGVDEPELNCKVYSGLNCMLAMQLMFVTPYLIYLKNTRLRSVDLCNLFNVTRFMMTITAGDHGGFYGSLIAPSTGNESHQINFVFEDTAKPVNELQVRALLWSNSQSILDSFPSTPVEHLTEQTQLLLMRNFMY